MEAVATSRSFADVTGHLANAQPHRIALSFEGRETTYADLERHTNQVANALIAAGLKTGDRVAYFGKNSDSYFEVFFGAAKMGGATTPINWRLAGPEVAYILQDSRAPILFVGPEFVDTVRKIAGECPDLKTIIAVEASTQEWPASIAWRDAQPDAPPPISSRAEDEVLQLYTSGTTGRPKGVMLMARNLMSLQDVLDRTGQEWARWSADDVS